MIPPSATPITMRAPISMANVLARPVRNEQQEKAMVARTSSALRLPMMSETRLTPSAAIAQMKENALALLAKQRNLEDARIYMSSVTDPYQPIEACTELSRSILEHLSERRDQPRVVIQTRSPLVTRDISILKRFKHLRVNMSITTDSDEIRKRFEPSCASIERRLDAVRELKAAGLKVGVCISPMLPIEDPIQFARTLRELDADRYTASYFHSSEKLFASGTGDEATKIAREMNWTFAKFQRVKQVLTQLVPRLNETAFSPE